MLEFGRFHGATLGEVADREPTYVDWIARTITRDRDLVRAPASSRSISMSGGWSARLSASPGIGTRWSGQDGMGTEASAAR